MGKSVYNSVDELPDLSDEPVHTVDPQTKKVTTYKSIDELPDLLKKKVSGELPSSVTPSPSQLPQKENKTSILSDFGILPTAVPKYQQSNQAVSTDIAQPKITATYDDFRDHNAERKEKHGELVKQAITNTANKVLKNKGVIKPEEEGKELNLSKYMQLANEKKKLQDAYDNGDATFAISKDGEVGLKRTTGWWESLSKGWNHAMKGNDEAAEFADMDAAQKVDFLKKKETEQPENKHPEYLGERGSALGSLGGLVGENAPFLVKAGEGAALGTALTLAAPITGGTSLAGLPAATAFIFTANDAKNQGIQSEVTRRFYKLKKDNPEANEVDLMKQAEQGALAGGLAGIATNAALMTSAKTPLSLESKNVVGKAIQKTLGSTAYAAGATAGIEGAKLAESNLEGIKTTSGEVAKQMGKTFSETATTLGILHVLTGAATGAFNLPKTVRSAMKYALTEDAKPQEVQSVLKANVEAGNITQDVADKVQGELDAYSKASGKVVEGLSPEAHASVAGLIEAKDKLVAEAKTKDDSAKDYYDEKIDGINQQIQKTINTGKPYAHEVDEMSGNKYTEQSVSEPISKVEPTTQEQGSKEPIPESTEPVSASTTEKATTILNKKFPKPEQDISEMSADEINDYSRAVKQHYKDQEVEFFGEEGAKKYREARSISNSEYANRESVKKADAVLKEMEDSLTKEQSDAFFGVNEKDDKYIYDADELRHIARTVRTIEESETLNELSRALKIPLLDFSKNPKDEGNLAAINAAKRKAQELGVDPKELIETSIKNIVKDLPDRDDKEFLASKLLSAIFKPTDKEPIAGLPKSENKPIQNETAKAAEISNTETQASTSNESTPKVEQPTKEGEGGGTEPPKVTEVPTERSNEDWTAIRKEKQREIEQVKNAYDKQKVKGWSETMKVGLEKVQKLHPDKNLYDAALTTMHNIKAGLGHGDLTTDEALATMQYLKREVGAKRAKLAEAVNSDNDLVRKAALIQDEALGNDYVNTALAIKDITTTAGRTLNYAQSELRLDPEHGLQIRRMELMKAKGGEKLSPEEMKWTEEKWKQEQEIMKQEEEVRSKAMQENFDNQISELHKEYEEKLKQAGKSTTNKKTSKERSLSQKGKSIADKIRQLKKPKGSTNIDFTLGTWDLAVEGIAKLVEAGSTIADAIEKLVKDGVIAFKEQKDRSSFEDHIVESIPEQKGKSEILNDIKEFAKENNTEEITNEMVGKGLIRDYVNSHIGDVEQVDILDVAAKDLKEILPNASKEKLIEAYLKENEFKQPSKKDLEGGIVEAKKQLNNIAKLTEDIEDLNWLKEIRQRSFPNERAKSEAEQNLINEKVAKLKEIKDRNNRTKEDNLRLETERNRQLKKVEELKEKRYKLEKGIIEKTTARQTSLDTPEIEKLKSEVKSIEKAINAAEAARKAAERKIESDRNKGIKKDNRKIESEAIRQVKKVQDLQDKKGKLENGIREKRSTQPKIDTPEIENLKQQVKDADKNLREAESLAKKLSTDIQDKKDKIDEMNAGIKRAEQGLDQIKTHRNKTESQIDAEIEDKKRELKRSISDNATDEQQQAKKLASEKENTKNKIKEFQRKLDEGEFEEKPPIKLRKQDAELIRLNKKQSVIEEEYRKKQHEFQEKKKSRLERLADFARSVYVAILIGSPHTLLKVGAMSALRPMSEAATKLSFGKIFDTFFTGISKVAMRGGESSSIQSVQKGFEAYFRQMGDKKMESMYQKASDEYDSAAKAYNDYKETSNPDTAKLEQLKNNMNDKLIKAQGSFIYKFIGGSSLKDALNALVNRSNEIEKQFGKVEGESFKYGNWLDKTNYTLGFIGRSHSALKTFSGRFSFAAGFMARLEGAVKNGEEINSPDKILEIAHESYLDWERGKYQQENAITRWWNKHVINKVVDPQHPEWEKYYDAIATAAKFDVAITRVPVNILHEGVMEYTLGAFRAIWMIAKNDIKLRKELKGEGVLADNPEFKAALKEKINQMDEKQAATIVRAFRKGGLGVGLYAMALISGAIHFGIFPHLGQKKKKEEKDLKPNELNPGQVMVGDNKFGEAASGIIEHIPALWPTFMGIGMAQAYQDQIEKGKSSREAMQDAIYTHLEVVESNIPQAKLIHPLGIIKDIGKTVTKKATDVGVISPEDKNIVDKDSEAGKVLTEKGVKIPNVGSTLQHKIETDDKHPNGIMSADEFKKFNEEVKTGMEEGIKNMLKKYYVVTKKGDDGKEILDRNEVLGKDLSQEDMKNRVADIKEKAEKAALEKLNLKKPKERNVTVKEEAGQ